MHKNREFGGNAARNQR